MREGKRASRAAACTLALVLTACGARLTDRQREAGIGLVGGADGGGVATGGPAGPVPGGTGGPGGPGGPQGQGTAGPGGGTSGPLPAGGNGGATDVGVTGTRLTIATIADVQGVQPGLFRSAWQAMQAVVAMVNSQGGIDGRLLDLVLLDSKTDTGATREAVLAACNKAFALVGSMSAFDSGGAEAVDDCKIPDITAITTSLARVKASYGFPVYPNRPDLFIIGSGNYIRDKYSAASKKAAQLWLNASTTKINAESKWKAYERVGFDFTYRRQTNVTEPNYTPYVQKMKDAGIRYVTMTSDWQSIARLLDAMRRQTWKPDVLEWDSVAYSPKFLEQTQGSAEGSFIYLNTALFEEASQNPEMQLYQQWLARVAPGVKPDYFGLYAWSAGRLFAELAKKAGPKLTRRGLVEQLNGTHSWDGNGLHAPHDVGARRSSNCTMFVRVQGNRFVRYAPAKGFYCNKGALLRVS